MNTSLLQIPQFNNKPIRHISHEGRVYYSLVDIMRAILDEDQDPSDYLTTLKRNDKQIPANCRKLKLPGIDGKFYPTDCSTEEEVYRILQSVPSQNVEPFKQWLAKVAKERIEEEKNPQLAVDRAVKTWQRHGRSEEWINARLKGIGVRNNITSTWKEHGIQGNEYGRLTDTLHKGVFKKKVKEHIDELAVTGNIRDHLSEMELMAIEFAERAAANITKHRNSQGFNEVKKDVKEGGEIGFDALSKYKKLISQ